jgi:hypothetical protein
VSFSDEPDPPKLVRFLQHWDETGNYIGRVVPQNGKTEGNLVIFFCEKAERVLVGDVLYYQVDESDLFILTEQ